MKITNLLFDLGGVIIDLNRMRCVEAYNKLGLTIANEMLGEYVQSGPFLPLEEGKLTNEQFREEIRKHISQEVTDEQIDFAFNQFLVGLPVQRLRNLQKLREKYNIYLLSNTNAIMWDSKIKELFTQDGLKREDYFDGIITSFEAKCVKPCEDIFKLTIEKFGIDPKETLFFDDGLKNIEAAAKLGFQTHHILPGEEFIHFFIP